MRVLATSRRAAGRRRGDRLARPLPGPARPRRARPAPPALEASGAGRLFLERARAAQPAFALTDANAAAVAEVCRRLDGIPLALELAAARVRVLTPEQLAARLGDRFRLLTGGGRTALRRQQTLQATVDWSHDLLAEPERALFRRLAVFPGGATGGFPLEAAEAVGAGDGAGAPVEAADVLDLLTGLVDKSLVLAEARGAEERYRLLETLRQYAEERLLQAGEAAAVRDRHAAWCLALGRAVAAVEAAGAHPLRQPGRPAAARRSGRTSAPRSAGGPPTPRPPPPAWSCSPTPARWAWARRGASPGAGWRPSWGWRPRAPRRAPGACSPSTTSCAGSTSSPAPPPRRARRGRSSRRWATPTAPPRPPATRGWSPPTWATTTAAPR